MLVSVYIRKQDEELWRKLPNKTEAVSRLLNSSSGDTIKLQVSRKPLKTDMVGFSPRVIKDKVEAVSAVQKVTRKSIPILNECRRHHVPENICAHKH